MASFQTNKIINYLWQPVQGRAHPHIYAIVDAARSESIYPKIVETQLDKICLHRGKKAEELAWVSPYLILLQPEDPFTLWLIDKGWGKSQAAFVQSYATLNELKHHFRACLIVYDEDGKSYFFRFYDPRVLRTYLPTCNARELDIVFGPGKNFIVEDEDPSLLLHFSRRNETLKQEKISLV